MSKTETADPKAKKKKPEMSLNSIIAEAGKDRNEGDICSNVTEISFDDAPERFSTGIEMFDAILGGDCDGAKTGGGLEWGRMTEIFGPNRSGKTELVRNIAASVLRDDPSTHVWYFDQEFALDQKTMANYPEFSLKTANGEKRFRSLRAADIESFFKTLYKALRLIYLEQQKVADKKEKIKLLIILDSVPALQSRQEVESEAFEKNALLPAPRLWSSETSKLRRYMSHVGGHLILVNQTRQKPGGNPLAEIESPGGEAIKFYSDYRFVTKKEANFSFTKGKNGAKGFAPSGFFPGIKIRKNKTGLPDRYLELVIVYKEHQGNRSGLTHHWSLFFALTAAKLIVAKGGKYKIKGSDEGFERAEWFDVYQREFLNGGPDTPLRQCFREWVARQLSSDMAVDGDDEDGDENEGPEE